MADSHDHSTGKCKARFCAFTLKIDELKIISLFFTTIHFELQPRRCVTLNVLLFIARLLHFKVERIQINDFFSPRFQCMILGSNGGNKKIQKDNKNQQDALFTFNLFQ